MKRGGCRCSATSLTSILESIGNGSQSIDVEFHAYPIDAVKPFMTCEGSSKSFPTSLSGAAFVHQLNSGEGRARV